jgi:hypothetical protein
MSDIISIADRLIEGVKYIKGQNLSGVNYLRAYYFEVENNLELLKLLREDVLKNYSPKKDNPDNPYILNYLTSLNTVVAASMLFDDSGGAKTSPVFAKLKKEEAQSLLRDTASIITKIEVLNRLATIPEEQKKLLHGINLKQRVGFIFGKLEAIKKVLRELEGVKELFQPHRTNSNKSLEETK